MSMRPPHPRRVPSASKWPGRSVWVSVGLLALLIMGSGCATVRSNSIDDAPAQVESARAELGLFALGEQLHCSGISDLSPPQAAQRLTEQGLTVSWRQMEYVDGIPAAAHRVTQPPPSHIIIDAHTGDPPSEVTLTIAAPDEPEAQERNRQLRSGC